MTRTDPTPERVLSPIVAEFAARVTQAPHPDSLRTLEHELAAAHPRNPIVGAAHEHDGAHTVELTFLWFCPEGTPAPRDVMIHINSVTDGHRDDIAPALFERIGGSRVWALSYRLPTDLVAAYRIVVAHADSDPLPRRGGSDRAAWLRIHELGRPDPRGVGTLPNPLGTQSSLLVGPHGWEHPAWGQGDFRRGSTLRTREVPTFAGETRRLHIYVPHGAEAPKRLLVLFDGDVWHELGVHDALDRWEGEAPAAVLVSSVSPERRAADLPHPERIAHVLRTEVLPAAFAELGKRYAPSDIIVSGQSYGGLASAAIVAEYPDIAAHGIAQSPSFHFVAAEEPRRPEGQRGDVSSRLSETTALGALVLTAGSNEDGLLDQARIARAALDGTGLTLSYREFTGGHDYAWWRHGLFWGLDELATLLDG